MVNLVLETVAGSETKVGRRTDTVDDEKNTLTRGSTTILILVPIERVQVDTLSVNHDAHVVVIPTIDLVEIELEQDKVGVGRNASVCLVSGFAPGSGIVPAEELGKRRCGVDDSVLPTGELAILKVLEGDDLGRGTNLDSWNWCRNWSRSVGWTGCRTGCPFVALELGRQLDVVEPG